MKKSVLLFLVLTFSLSAFSQNVIQLFNTAGDFFDLMKAEKYTDARAMFGDTLKSKLSEENLKKLWTGVSTKFGKAISFDPIQSKTEGNFFAVTVEGKFENGNQNFILGFDKTQKIVGVFFAPNKPSNEYSLPSYADSSTYVEKSVYLGSGPKQLAAIVTTPKNVKNFPVVVFVHGSGPNDMDETVGPNKPFKDIAGGLATKRIGSVRYVKRTLVHPNDFAGAFTVKEEVTNDALAAVALAKTIQGADAKKIFVFGHSLGGMLAPRIAASAPDLAGIILAAAPARKLTDIIIEQNKDYFTTQKDTSAKSKQLFNEALAEINKSKITKLAPGVKPDSLVVGLPAAYWVDLNNYNQVAVAKSLVKQRILVIQGGFDFQVSKTDFDLWSQALGKKKNVKLKFYPNLNHLFSVQNEKGNTQQYLAPASVYETLVIDLGNWIKGGIN